MTIPTSSRTVRRLLATAGVVGLALGAAACGSSDSGSGSGDKIGVALILLGLQLKSKDRVLEGRTVLVSLRDTMRQEGHAELDDHFRERLKTADQVLATFE